MASIQGRLTLFCNNSTIRGVPKIVRSKSRFLRGMWFIFVIIMFLLLNVSAIRIIINFLEYDITIQTKVSSVRMNKFPALTLCNHNPFSKRAKDLWDSGSYPSPTYFNQQLRTAMKKLILEGKVQMAKALNGYDSIRQYYQSLNRTGAVTLGHTVNETISHCMIVYDGDQVSVGSPIDCRLNITLLSSSNFFNCYTLEPTPNITATVSSLTLIVDLGRHPDPATYQQAFFIDVFEQAFGLRVQIHESGILPNMDKEAMHIEPGKMVEISYTTTEWQMLDSPKQRCYREVHQFPIIDFGQTYHYTREACINQYLANYVRDTCGCVMAGLPRRYHPDSFNPPLPYCGYVDPNNVTAFFERLKCFETADLGKARQYAFNILCLPRCTENRYPSHFSVTQWRSSSWQMHWLLDQNLAWRNLEKAELFKDHSLYNKSLEGILKYLSLSNLTFADNENKYMTDSLSFAYIVLRRSNFDLTSKTEKLNLSLEALLSRIGGLCSLCLGLTCAFVFELVEFCYLLGQRKGDKRPTITEQEIDLNDSRKTEVLISNGERE